MDILAAQAIRARSTLTLDAVFYGGMKVSCCTMSIKISSLIKIFLDAGYMSLQNISTMVMLWTFNFVFLIACLIKMLVYGDPIMKHQSSESHKYWKHKKQSDLDFERVS